MKEKMEMKAVRIAAPGTPLENPGCPCLELAGTFCTRCRMDGWVLTSELPKERLKELLEASGLALRDTEKRDAH